MRSLILPVVVVACAAGFLFLAGVTQDRIHDVERAIVDSILGSDPDHAEARAVADDVGALAISTALMRMDMTDADQAGAIDIDFHYRLTTNNAEAIAMGAQHRTVVVRMECEPRATCLSAIGTLINNSLVVNDGGWPEAAVNLPRPRKP